MKNFITFISDHLPVDCLCWWNRFAYHFNNCFLESLSIFIGKSDYNPILTMERIWNIEGEFMRNPDLRLEDVREIQDWLQNQPHLPYVSGEFNLVIFNQIWSWFKIDFHLEFEIVLFLHSNYYELEATKTTIEHYYTCRASYKELFTCHDLNSKGLLQAHEAV